MSIIRPMADITGQKFGRLTAVRREKIRGKAAVWFCRCDCGGSIRAR